jgi:hypothetical protein
MALTRKNLSIWRKISQNTTLSFTIQTWISATSNPRCCGDRPAINRLIKSKIRLDNI